MIPILFPVTATCPDDYIHSLVVVVVVVVVVAAVVFAIRFTKKEWQY